MTHPRLVVPRLIYIRKLRKIYPMENTTLPHQCCEEMADIKGLFAEMRRMCDGRPDKPTPMLQMVQESLGHLPETALAEIAQLTGMTKATVFGVATFYAQFRLQPVGKHLIKVCTGTACHVRGCGRIMKDIQDQLNVEPGQTTADRMFTVETVACFGSCALAPVVLVDESVHGRMSSAKAKSMLENLVDPTCEANHSDNTSGE